MNLPRSDEFPSNLFHHHYIAGVDDDDCLDKEEDKKERGNDSDEDDDGEVDSANDKAEDDMLKVEAQILDILSALLLSINGGKDIKLWAGRLLTRCVCQRLGSSPLRFLQATNHADLQDAMPPIECFELALPETSSSYGEVDDFITAFAITSASEGTIVVGSSQGMVRTLIILQQGWQSGEVRVKAFLNRRPNKLGKLDQSLRTVN